jgi:hypothetical protein
MHREMATIRTIKLQDSPSKLSFGKNSEGIGCLPAV